jgi:NADH:ubiquinone oxidoreductase subunit F (NADH-binding)
VTGMLASGEPAVTPVPMTAGPMTAWPMTAGPMTAGRVPAERLLAAAAADLAQHRERTGPVPWRERPRILVGDVEAAGLTGRGGAGFPTWRKLAAVASGRRPVVVANAAEGEPASAKDAALLAWAPHLVLDGLQLAAEAVGSREAYLYATGGPGLAKARQALGERRARGWDRVPVTVVEARPAFVAGEESAVVARIEGRAALPRDRTRLVVESGLRGRPTLVQNVETLAHLALLARRGPGWFRRLGTPGEPGTFLATVSRDGAAPVVVEAPYGVRLGDLLGLAGADPAAAGALLVGGYHGAWLPADPGLAAPVSREGLAPWQAAPGAGVVVVLGRWQCGLAASARILGYLARQSAGQCGPCLNGLPALAGVLARLAAGERNPRLPGEVHRLAALVDGRGACHHPDGSVRMLRSALRTFRGDVQAHLAGWCTAQAGENVR